jgi:RsiW-degrading membrane proteinase PrsW (M82 family)
MYIIQSAVSASVFDTQAAFSTQFAQFLFRMITGPLLHAAWAGTVGWFIGYAAMRQEPRWPVVGLGIAFMAVLHGVHDVLVGGVLGIATSAVTLIILFAYMTHDENPDCA